MIILEENDIIAVHLKEHLAQNRLEDFKKILKDMLNIEVIIIPVGVSLEVYRKNYEQD